MKVAVSSQARVGKLEGLLDTTIQSVIKSKRWSKAAKIAFDAKMKRVS